MPPAAQSSVLHLGLIPGAATTWLTSTGNICAQEEAKGSLRPVRKFPTTFSCQVGKQPFHARPVGQLEWPIVTYLT